MLVDSEMQTLAAGQPKIRGWELAQARDFPVLQRAEVCSEQVELHIDSSVSLLLCTGRKKRKKKERLILVNFPPNIWRCLNIL